MPTNRIVAEVETKDRYVRAVWLQTWNDDGTLGTMGAGLSKKSWEKNFINNTTLASLKSDYDSGTALVFWRRLSNTYWAETASDAAPSSTTFPTLAPPRWMQELNPMQARSETDVIHLSSFNNLPDVGENNVVYVIEDSTLDRPTSLIYDGTQYNVVGVTGVKPQIQEYAFKPKTYTLRDDGSTTPANAGQALDPIRLELSALSSSPFIPTSIVSQTRSTGASGVEDTVEAEESVSTRVSFAISVRPVRGATAATYHDGTAIQTAEPERYDMRFNVYYKPSGQNPILVSNRNFVGLLESADTAYQYYVTTSVVPYNLNDGDELYATIQGISDSDADTPITTQLEVVSGGITVRRYVSTVASEIAQVDNSARYVEVLHEANISGGVGTGVQSSLEFSEPVDLDRYPLLALKLRWDRVDYWAAQDLTPFDVTDVGLAPDAATARTNAASFSNYYERQLYVALKNDAKARPVIFHGRPWIGWYTDTLYYFKMVLYGTGRTASGVGLYGLKSASDLYLKAWVELRRKG